MKRTATPLVRRRAIGLTPEDELVALTRDLERLKRERRKWARKLKATDTELRAVRREHTALLRHVKNERAPDIMPSQLFGGATGYRRATDAVATTGGKVTIATSDFVDAINEGKSEKER